VRQRLRAGQPLYEVEEALLTELAPDVLITQTHCEVCAVSPADLVHNVSATLQRRQVVALSTGTLAAILQGFLDVASVLGKPAEGLALVEAISVRLAALAEQTRALPHPTIVCLEWIEPAFAMGNWGPELVELAVGDLVLRMEISGAARVTLAPATWHPRFGVAEPTICVVADFSGARLRTDLHWPVV
jgi:iron complex transport system substrate-binding protein